ncbi:hypothetical protein BDAP_000705 [Binucleata daphniae]
MAILEVRAQEESIAAGSLKPKHLLIIDESGRREYVRINTVQKVKTGKHGAAKVMLSGKEIKTGKTVVLTYNGGISVLIATLTKKQYVIEDIFEEEDSFYMRPNDSSGIPSEVYPYNQMDQEDVKSVIDAFNANNRQELIITLMLAPGYCSFDDIRPNTK